jgi:hypothetical protein
MSTEEVKAAPNAEAKPKQKRTISPEHRAKLVANAKKAGEARAKKIAERTAAAQSQTAAA